MRRAREPAWFYGAVMLAAVALLLASLIWWATRDDPGFRGGFGPGMMGYVPRGGGERVTSIEGARGQAERFADRLELGTGEVMRFDANYYVELTEADGQPATEVLVNPSTGAVAIEYGPAMMWNTRYGMMSGRHGSSRGAGAMGGMMGYRIGPGGDLDPDRTARRRGPGVIDGGMMGAAADPTWAPDPESARPTIAAGEAERIANRWLRENERGVRAEDPQAFPGYFTLHTVRGDRVEGMLSVNSYTGAVWPHWWHGRFISMSE